MALVYMLGYGLISLRKPGSGPPVERMVITLSPGNTLQTSGLQFAPEWFVSDDFTLTFTGGSVEFTWTGSYWETDGAFPTANGLGVVTQGANSTPAQWLDAEIGDAYWIDGYSIAGYVEGNL